MYPDFPVSRERASHQSPSLRVEDGERERDIRKFRKKGNETERGTGGTTEREKQGENRKIWLVFVVKKDCVNLSLSVLV